MFTATEAAPSLRGERLNSPTRFCASVHFFFFTTAPVFGGKDNLFSLNINRVAFWRHVYLRVKSISVRTNIISMSAVLCDLFGLYYASEHGEKVSKCPLLTEEETQRDWFGAIYILRRKGGKKRSAGTRRWDENINEDDAGDAEMFYLKACC